MDDHLLKLVEATGLKYAASALGHLPNGIVHATSPGNPECLRVADPRRGVLFSLRISKIYLNYYYGFCDGGETERDEPLEMQRWAAPQVSGRA